MNFSRQHPLVRTGEMVELFRMNIYKEPGKRNGRAWARRAARHLGLRVLDAPTSGDAVLCYMGTHELCAYTTAKGSPDLRLDREL